MSTIRSIEEIIKQDKEKKEKKRNCSTVNQTFSSEIGYVINVTPGASITIILESGISKV